MQYKKYATIVSSFLIMVCLGGIYAWSIFASQLQSLYDFSVFQTQIIFGTTIIVFPVTMIFAGKIKHLSPRIIAIISASCFGMGYYIAAISSGSFALIILGLGILVGIGTGLGYVLAITLPVSWMPHKKGLITGISAAGFGIAAVILAFFTETLLLYGFSLFEIFTWIALLYGSTIFLSAFFLFAPQTHYNIQPYSSIKIFLRQKKFKMLLWGIFLGTFAGLLIIGSLTSIGGTYIQDNHILILGVSAFACSNFLGRITWGIISDRIGGAKSISIALLFQSCAIALLAFLQVTPPIYLLLAFCIGFGFSGNFVLFAKETAHRFGIGNLSTMYPYVFLGYAIAGISGPSIGGILYDILGRFTEAIILAAILSFIGALLFYNKQSFTREGKKLFGNSYC